VVTEEVALNPFFFFPGQWAVEQAEVLQRRDPGGERRRPRVHDGHSDVIVRVQQEHVLGLHVAVHHALVVVNRSRDSTA